MQTDLDSKTKDELIRELQAAYLRITNLEILSLSPEQNKQVFAPSDFHTFLGETVLDLKAILDTAYIQDMMIDFQKLTGAAFAILDINGNILVASGWQEICINYHRKCPESAKNCQKSDFYLEKNAYPGRYVAYRCGNNLWDIVTPLYIEKNHVGNIYAGQFFYEDEIVDVGAFVKQADEYGFDRENYLAALDKVPRFKRAQVELLMDFLLKITVLISNLGVQNLQLSRVVNKLQLTTVAFRESENRLRNIFENAPIGIFQSTPGGRYRMVNACFSRMIGFENPQEMVDSIKDISSLYIDPLQREKFKSILSINGVVSDFPIHIRRIDGRTMWMSAYAKSMCDLENDSVYYDGFVLDITERKKAEKELCIYRDNLEDMVAKRTNALQDEIEARRRIQGELFHAKETAEAANQSKSMFLANMSHELRTPLNAVLGFSQIMRVDPGLSEDQKENLGFILRSGEHLLDLINDVLDISKIEIGRVPLVENEFNLYLALQTVDEMLSTRAKMKGLSLNLKIAADVPQVVRADEKRLRQVIVNLAGNAVKFTETGGVTIRTSASDDRLFFEVEDSGPGIIHDDIPRLFERFEQGGINREGVGLGLYISRKLVEIMGGTIMVKSEMGRGSLFSFDIRYAPAVETPALCMSSSLQVTGFTPCNPTLRILVVDDNADSRILMIKFLKPLGFIVDTAENGKEAVHLYSKYRPNLVLMDMRMPVMDGYEATRRIRASENGILTPIIAITASAFEEDKQQIFEAGVDDFIRKPVRSDELYENIRKYLGIEYVCGAALQSSKETLDKSTLLKLVKKMPLELLKAMDEALKNLDIDYIKTLLTEVDKHSPVLAASLKRLMDNYEIDMLSDILQTGST